MIFHDTGVEGCYLVEPERLADHRGFFARTFDAAEFRLRGLDVAVEQGSVSFNIRAGTLRGLHYQASPHAEAKLVRCTRGRLFDVVVDLRPASHTAHRWIGTELHEENRLSIYIPAGCAHGFVTLVDHTEVAYAISTSHHPEAARGIRWNDPDLAIRWPVNAAAMTISDRDRRWPLVRDIQSSAPDTGTEARQ